MLHRSSRGILAALGPVAVLAWLGASVVADENTKKSLVPPVQESKAADKDPFDVPNGTIEELQKYIDGLNKIHPSSSLRPAVAELHKKRATAQRNACDKILAAKPTPEQAQAAVRLKVASLAVLGRLGDPTAQTDLESTVDQVEKLGLKEMIRDVQLAALENRAEQASAMPDAEYGKFVERLKVFLQRGPIDTTSAKLAVNVAMAAELSNRPRLAVDAYRELGTVLATSKDEKATDTAATMLGAARRLDLVGKPFVLEGSTVAGKPLDWKKYEGKIVLIDFFATWCGPCRQEIPNITKCYKAYHKRGFDVVRISIDRDRKAIVDFVEKEKHPWTILLDRNEARGTDNSMATYYGIFAIPQMILVGKDGKVLALNVRGEQLGKKLEELLGPAEEERSTKRSANSAENAGK
ncbi:MAG: TlpA disulfide reductase family protein [Planctomycetota bacterium]